jgi:hypothetical protein
MGYNNSEFVQAWCSVIIVLSTAAFVCAVASAGLLIWVRAVLREVGQSEFP